MSKHLAELCTLLVDDVYGKLPSRILSVLLTDGRLSLPILLHRARLPPRHVKAGLAVLILKHLVLHHVISTSKDTGTTTNEILTTYYEANIRNVYDLIRTGKAAVAVQNALGEDHRGLVDKFLFEKCTTNRNAMRWLDEEVNGATAPNDLPNGEAHTNGTYSMKDNSVTDTHFDRATFMGALFDQGYVVKSRMVDFMPDHDFDDMVTAEVTALFGGPPKGKDDKADYAIKLAARKSEIRSDYKHYFQMPTTSSSKRSVREPDSSKSADEGRPRKQRRLNLGKGYETNGAKHEEHNFSDGIHHVEDAPNEVEVEEHTPELALRVNRDKLDVLRRNEYLVALSSRSIDSGVVGPVYRALLSSASRHLYMCYDRYALDNAVDGSDDESDDEMVDTFNDNAAETKWTERELRGASRAVSVDEVAKELPDDLDLVTFMQPSEKRQKRKNDGEVDRPSKKSKQVNGAHVTKESEDDEQAHTANDGASDIKRIEHIRAALGMLANHRHRFVHRTASSRETKWRVNFPALSRTLIQSELENIIAARFGQLATLIVRHLVAVGKCEEKGIASACLLHVKEVRAALSAMQASGFVEAQEVPKDAQRTPAKTIYLFYFDQDRCRKLILNDVYKTMSRLLQRRRVEKAKVESLIEKANRTDVRGHEDEYLGDLEKERLAEWERKEEKILVQVSRLDSMVTIMRDLLPH